MSRVFTLMFFSLLFIAPNFAFGQRPAKDVIQDLKPALDTQTIAIINMDLANLQFQQLGEQIGSNIKSPIQSKLLNQIASDYQDAFTQLHRAGATEINIVFKLGTLVPDNRLIAIKCNGSNSIDQVKGVLQKLDGLFGENARISSRDDFVYTGSFHWKHEWNELAANPPEWYQLHSAAELGSLEKAIENAGDAPIRMAFSLSADHKRALVEFDPESFAAGRIDSPASIENLEWISLSFEPKSRSLKLQIETGNSDSANAVAKKLGESFSFASAAPAFRNNVPELCEWLQSLDICTNNNSIQLNLKDESYDAAINGIAESVFHQLNQQRFSQSIGQMRQMIFAIHKYLDAEGSFPPAFSKADDGSPLLSWRVLILPYLGEQELYERFHLDEPWDSEHNLKLAKQTPEVYARLFGKELDGKTRFVAPFGKTAIAEKGATIGEITDGTSATVAIMEVTPAQAVTWTMPDKFSIEQEDLILKIVEKGATGFWTTFCDGSAQYIPKEIDPQSLKWLMTINDGNVVGDYSIQPKRSAIDFLPSFWFNELIESTWIIGAAE